MTGKRIVVTGAAGFLGTAVATTLVAQGWQVIGVDLAPEARAAGLEDFIGGVDLTDENAAAALAPRLAGKPIDGLVNIAGGFRWETVADGSLDTWDMLYRMNVRTAVIASRALLPLLRANPAGAAIVNVSANGSVRADMGMGAYAASKAGVSRFTEALAAELKDAGVRVNAVMPSIIDTPVNRADMPDAEFDRWVAPEALADVIGFLLSDAARAITGALLPVTGRV
jgi:NAD(P)-dependent dehydrogenase (short-subunit alcohol dehydrogenase family)